MRAEIQRAGAATDVARRTLRSMWVPAVLLVAQGIIAPNAIFRKADYDDTISDVTKQIEAAIQKKSRATPPILYEARGKLYALKGSREQAISDFNRAIESQPGNHVLLELRGDVFKESNDLDRALGLTIEWHKRNLDALVTGMAPSSVSAPIGNLLTGRPLIAATGD